MKLLLLLKHFFQYYFLINYNKSVPPDSKIKADKKN